MSAHNDTAFLRMFIIVLGALVAFTFIIMVAAKKITGDAEQERGQDPRMQAAIAERIQRVGSVNVAQAQPAAAQPKSGAEIVASACNACHSTGVLGAPKVGDKDAWSTRLAAQGGLDGLTASAITGKGGMPPKGGAMVSDGEIRAAIEHMLKESGVDASATTAAPAGPVEAVAQAAETVAETVADAAQAVAAAVAPETAGESAPDLAKGKTVYDSACFVCHTTGAAGAPKLGDKAAWAPRIAQGMDALVKSALTGKNAMPPKGGRMDLSDADIEAGVAYLVSQAE